MAEPIYLQFPVYCVIHPVNLFQSKEKFNCKTYLDNRCSVAYSCRPLLCYFIKFCMYCILNFKVILRCSLRFIVIKPTVEYMNLNL